MAQRRMFSLLVTDTDNFLDMPLSAQALYFHLGMHGDDEGFVGSPRKIARAIGCNQDDLKILIVKGFIIAFESGVVAIRDWHINNTLKNDRFHESIYEEERKRLCIGKSKRYEVGQQVDTSWNQVGVALEPTCIQSVSEAEPELNITQHNSTKPKTNSGTASVAFDRFWTAYPNKVGKGAARKAFAKIKGVPVETMIEAIEKQKQSRKWLEENGKYIPNPSTWLNQERWEDIVEIVNSTEQGGYSIPTDLGDLDMILAEEVNAK